MCKMQLKHDFEAAFLSNAAPCSVFCSVLIFQLNYIQFVVLVLECFEFFFQTFFFFFLGCIALVFKLLFDLYSFSFVCKQKWKEKIDEPLLYM